MKNLKKTSILLASLAVVFGAGSASNNSANNVRKIRKAAGDTHNLIFKGEYRERNYALSSAGWWGYESTPNNVTFTGDEVNIINGTTAYFTNGAVNSGERYVISYDLKTDGNTYFSLETVLPAWSSLQAETLVNNSDYVHYNFIYTAPKNGDSFIPYFKVTGGKSITIKNLYIYNTTSTSVIEGQTIETLPSIKAKDGKRGYWAIDGKEIKVGDTYNYSTDKVVDLVYEDAYSITYHNGGAIDLASDTKYWKSGTNLVKEDNVLHMKNEDNLADQPIHTYDVSDSSFTMLEKGKKYKLVFDIKCDNLYLRIANCSPWEVLLGGWTNHAEFTKKELTFEASSSGVATIRFRVDTTGNMFIKNLRLYEISTIEYSKNQPLGVLPEINLGKFDNGVWTIDGETITNETKFNYSSANKDAYVKYDLYTTDKFVAEWKQLRALGGENGICAILVKDSEAQTAFNNLMEKYESLNDDDKNIINSTLDVEGVTIGATINYIKNVLDGVTKTEGKYDINSGVVITSSSNYDKTSLIALFAILGIVTISGYYVIEKKKYSK